MTSAYIKGMTDFMRQVLSELDGILANEDGAAHRLGLTRSVVEGWRGYFERMTPDQLAELVEKVCRDNNIPLARYEADGQPRQAAEMILGTVDAFLRKTLGVTN